MNTYSSYKDSGVEWIGEIPSGWSMSKLKYISKLFTGNSLNQSQKEQYESDDMNHIPYISSKDIDVNYHTVNYINGLRIPPTDNPLKTCKKGGFLLCVEGGSSGRKMTFLKEEVCFVNKLCCFESKQSTKYQYYFVQTTNFQSKFQLSLTGLIGGVSITTLRNFEVSVPPLQEQQQISDYLDHKTSKIDALIEKTEQKIELLKEQRTSLINTTVTKGLNPNVEMKDSGVEWIGKIPSGWDIKKLKYISSLKTDKDETNKGDIKISPENVESYTGVCFNLYSDHEGKGVVFKSGDILFNKLRLYLVKIILPNYEGYSMGEMIVIRMNKDIENKFYFYTFFNQGFIDLLNSQSTGVKLPRVSPDVIMDSKLPLPPFKDQQQIVDYLDLETSKIDKLVDIESKRIDLLKEYRQSLISEVVTGKVDTRSEVLV